MLLIVVVCLINVINLFILLLMLVDFLLMYFIIFLCNFCCLFLDKVIFVINNFLCVRINIGEKMML